MEKVSLFLIFVYCALWKGGLGCLWRGGGGGGGGGGVCLGIGMQLPLILVFSAF